MFCVIHRTEYGSEPETSLPFTTLSGGGPSSGAVGQSVPLECLISFRSARSFDASGLADLFSILLELNSSTASVPSLPREGDIFKSELMLVLFRAELVMFTRTSSFCFFATSSFSSLHSEDEPSLRLIFGKDSLSSMSTEASGFFGGGL